MGHVSGNEAELANTLAGQKTNKERNPYLDFMRGIAIFLMLWGHCVQYCIPQEMDFFENVVFKTIYSFHMPLFAMISGYICHISLEKRNMYEYVGKRAIGLTQAIVFGGILNFLIVNLPNAIITASPGKVFTTSILYSSSSLWFLWSILGASISVGVAIKLQILSGSGC